MKNYNTLNSSILSQGFPAFGAKPYLLDIAQHLFANENNFKPSNDYLEEIQGEEINKGAREKLVCWIFEISEELKVSQKTKELAVLYTDVILSTTKLNLYGLQLIAISSLLLAIKIEEQWLYTLEQAVADSGNQYSTDDIYNMELYILEKLSWRVNLVTPYEMLDIFLSFLKTSNATIALIKSKAITFITLSMIEYELSLFSSSTIAIAAIVCAMSLNGKQKIGEQYLQLFANKFPVNLQEQEIIEEDVDDENYSVNIECLEEANTKNRIELNKTQDYLDNNTTSHINVEEKEEPKQPQRIGILKTSKGIKKENKSFNKSTLKEKKIKNKMLKKSKIGTLDQGCPEVTF